MLQTVQANWNILKANLRGANKRQDYNWENYPPWGKCGSESRSATLRHTLHNNSIKIHIASELFSLIMSTNLNASRENFTNSITRYVFTFSFAS